MPNKRIALCTLVATAAVMLSACATVDLSPGGKDVKVLERARTQHCKHLGQTHVSVAKLMRGEKPIENDLQILARNSAAEMNGDTVTPKGSPKNGEQTFDVYQCIMP